jgi:hypothetical protein
LGFAAAFAQRKQPLKAELQRAARGEFAGLGAWEERLISAFSNAIERASGGHRAVNGPDSSMAGEFLEQLNQGLTAIAQAQGDVTRWHDVVTAFRRHAVPCCGDDLRLCEVTEDLLQDARIATAYAVERKEAQERMQLERFTRKLADVGAALTGAFDLEELARRIETELPKVGITSCFVSAYEPLTLEQRKQAPRQAKLVAAFDTNQRLPVYGAAFDIHSLAPTELWPPGRLHGTTVLPLFLKDVDLGVALFERKAVKGSVLEFLREQLSIALYGALLARHAAR